MWMPETVRICRLYEDIEMGQSYIRGRMQHMCIVLEPRGGWPRQPVGIYDIADLLGSSVETVKRALQDDRKLYGVRMKDLGKVPVDRKRTCIRCGAIVGDQRCSMYCQLCRAENRRMGQERLEKRTQDGQAKYQTVKVRHEVPYERKSPLARVAYEARQQGLTYGQYMTLKTARWGICPKTNLPKS